MGRMTERDAAFCSKKIHVAKSQLELQLARTVGDNEKRFFLNILITKGGVECCLLL